jgi:hypothetical protein
MYGGYQANRDRRIEMTSRYVANRVCHGQNGQTKRQRHPREPNSQTRKSGGEHCAAAASKHQPKGPYEFSTCSFWQ